MYKNRAAEYKQLKKAAKQCFNEIPGQIISIWNKHIGPILEQKFGKKISLRDIGIEKKGENYSDPVRLRIVVNYEKQYYIISGEISRWAFKYFNVDVDEGSSSLFINTLDNYFGGASVNMTPEQGYVYQILLHVCAAALKLSYICGLVVKHIDSKYFGQFDVLTRRGRLLVLARKYDVGCLLRVLPKEIVLYIARLVVRYNVKEFFEKDFFDIPCEVGGHKLGKVAE